MIVAALLFAFLNFFCNWLDNRRADIRKEADYEILILTDDKNVIQEIVNEDFVRSAYMGKAYATGSSTLTDDSGNDVVANALHINVDNVLLVKYYDKYIKETYGVNTELNEKVLQTYMMDDDGLGRLIICCILFISFVFAIIGVGMIRNSVQLSALERVRDYGDLRCIGATKRQVKAIIFRQALILETAGIAGGIFFGYLLSIPVSIMMEYEPGFHFMPILLLAFVFYGDMYFAVGDGVKNVLKVSPIEAVKGNYRIKTGHIKQRGSSIWSVIFGVEGDYAYKNIRRNTGRFIKTVCVMAFGLGTVVVVCGVIGVGIKYISSMNEDYGYYQEIFYADTFSTDTSDEMKAQLYSPEALKVISDTDGVEDLKYFYHDTLYTAERGWVKAHLDSDYLLKSTESSMYNMYDIMKSNHREKPWDESLIKINDHLKSYRDSGKGLVDYKIFDEGDEGLAEEYGMDTPVRNWGTELTNTCIDIYGYDNTDYERYKSALIEGTTELSENGVLLLAESELYLKNEFNENYDDNEISMSYMPEKRIFRLTDLSLGDEIKVVDPVELDKLVCSELERAKGNDLDAEKKKWIIESARQKLVEEGKVKTLVVEGLVRGDPNMKSDFPALIVPLDNYYSLTGQGQNDYSGIKFHVGNILSSGLGKDKFRNALQERLIEEDGVTFSDAISTCYIDMISEQVLVFKQMIVFGLVVLLIVLVSTFNTINSTISILKLREMNLHS